ncbi:hypothetical protein NQZ68_029426 [Dissostichus eleginoides]|nr:hypothetical protein NQZ68_029426 [Dissostichus eleginoides]
MVPLLKPSETEHSRVANVPSEVSIQWRSIFEKVQAPASGSGTSPRKLSRAGTETNQHNDDSHKASISRTCLEHIPFVNLTVKQANYFFGVWPFHYTERKTKLCYHCYRMTC